MPDRIIRDELLTSERYWGCSPEARCLFLSILLSADDAARYTGAPFALRTKCMAGTVSHERIEAILAELVDADLVRRYVVEGRPYLFVPRFGNRKRYIASSKFPSPPKEINDMMEEKSDLGLTQVIPKSDSGLTQDRHARAGVGVGRGRGSTVAANGRIRFDFPSRSWLDITAADRALWAEAYPAVDLDRQLARAAAWLVANPKNSKSNYARFLDNWLKAEQDRAPAVAQPSGKPKLSL